MNPKAVCIDFSGVDMIGCVNPFKSKFVEDNKNMNKIILEKKANYKSE